MHNQLAARQVYGDEWMGQFTSGAARNVPVAREAEAPVWAADRRMVCAGRHDTFA
jgi:regulator of RNase E activity RraA